MTALARAQCKTTPNKPAPDRRGDSFPQGILLRDASPTSVCHRVGPAGRGFDRPDLKRDAAPVKRAVMNVRGGRRAQRV